MSTTTTALVAPGATVQRKHVHQREMADAANDPRHCRGAKEDPIPRHACFPACALNRPGTLGPVLN